MGHAPKMGHPPFQKAPKPLTLRGNKNYLKCFLLLPEILYLPDIPLHGYPIYIFHFPHCLFLDYPLAFALRSFVLSVGSFFQSGRKRSFGLPFSKPIFDAPLRRESFKPKKDGPLPAKLWVFTLW
jgi:hypothetical protein